LFLVRRFEGNATLCVTALPYGHASGFGSSAESIPYPRVPGTNAATIRKARHVANTKLGSGVLVDIAFRPIIDDSPPSSGLEISLSRYLAANSCSVILFSVLNKNLENLAFFAPFGRSSNWAAGAAVAVGMGKPAFCAGFQAPRRGVGTRHESTINTPSERHFHSETLDFQGFGKIL
jgi:hypothetical protein